MSDSFDRNFLHSRNIIPQRHISKVLPPFSIVLNLTTFRYYFSRSIGCYANLILVLCGIRIRLVISFIDVLFSTRIFCMILLFRKMESVQRKATLLATGALRTTPSDLLFTHANMLSLRSHIKLICHGSALHIAMLPKEHPLYATARRAMGRRLHRHTSPLYDILDSAGICTNTIETVNTITKPPTWRNQVRTTIAKTREEAEQSAKDDESDIRIFTDGSR